MNGKKTCIRHDICSDFGTYSLSWIRDCFRVISNKSPSGRMGRWMVSLCRFVCLIGLKRGSEGPFDISIFDGVCTRVYPSTNRCEWKVFAGFQNWDSVERQALEKQIVSKKTDLFVLVDVGSNVGLYSLFVFGKLKILDRKSHIIAIEPDRINRERMEFNIRASNADIVVVPVAVGGSNGMGHMTGGLENCDAMYFATGNDEQSESVEIQTLDKIVALQSLDHIDAMKINVEGQDMLVLQRFFDFSDKLIWPKFLIVETKGLQDSEISETIIKNG